MTKRTWIVPDCTDSNEDEELIQALAGAVGGAVPLGYELATALACLDAVAPIIDRVCKRIAEGGR